MKLIRKMVLPWFLYFLGAVAATIAIGAKIPGLRLPQHKVFEGLNTIKMVEPLTVVLLGGGALLCLLTNIRTLKEVGIWMVESLPDSLNYSGSFRWFLRAVKAALIAAAFWFVGQLPWIPLIWQAAVLPLIVTISLFVIVFSLIGPILKLSSQLPGSRVITFVLSLPVLALIPITAYWIGGMIVNADRASRPDMHVAVESENDRAVAAVAPVEKPAEPLAPTVPVAPVAKAPHGAVIEGRLQAIRTALETKQSCSEQTRFILASLDPRGPGDTVFWSVKGLACTETKAVIALPRLATLSSEHESSAVRAASILAMKRYGQDNVNQVAYRLYKRLSDTEAPEVVEATAQVLAPLGGDAERIASKKLKGLLEDPKVGVAAAKALIVHYRRDDLVGESVAANLEQAPENKMRAISMLCLLSPAGRKIAEPHVGEIVGMIRTAGAKDPAVQALGCMGRTGFNALSEEVKNPKKLDRALAAHALAELNVKLPEAIETANNCARDGDENVRQWCSRSLGQQGAPALPKILDLLKSSDKSLKDAGQNALRFFDDVSAKDDLRKIRAENSGWMANNRKLQIAQAVGTALQKIEIESRSDEAAESQSE